MGGNPEKDFEKKRKALSAQLQDIGVKLRRCDVQAHNVEVQEGRAERDREKTAEERVPEVHRINVKKSLPSAKPSSWRRRRAWLPNAATSVCVPIPRTPPSSKNSKPIQTLH